VTAAILIIDASALVKLIVREPDSATFMAMVPDGVRLTAPAHLLAETGEVISRKMRAGHVDERQLALIVRQLDTDVEMIPLIDLFDSAIRIALEVSASVYDCLYVAAATQRECQLLTADRRLVDRLSGTRYARLLIPLDSAKGPR
jgi:predicted nucleic acid-binding protein